MGADPKLIEDLERLKHECEGHLKRIEAIPGFRVFERTPETGEIDVTQRETARDRALIEEYQRFIDRLTSA